MGQPLLPVGHTNAPVSKANLNSEPARPAEQEDSPFSSTLASHVKQAEKSREQPDSRQDVKKADAGENQQEMQAQEARDGKNLPDPHPVADEQAHDQESADVTETGENLNVTDKKAASESEDSVVTEAQMDAETVVNPLATAAVEPAVSAAKQSARQAEAVPANTKTVLSAQADRTAAVQSGADKAVAVQADSTPAVRADILHAITQKQSRPLDGKSDLALEKEMKPNSGIRQFEQLLGDQQQKVQQLAAAKGGFVFKDNAEPVSVLTSVSATLSSGSGMTAEAKAASLTPPVYTIQPAVNSAAWGKVLHGRLVWMAKEGIQQAELRLNPANLGPVEVKMHMQHDQVNITFMAPHAATRDALEQALPRLRESFQDNGMNLADASVSDQAAQQQSDAEQDSEVTMHHHDSRSHDDSRDGDDRDAIKHDGEMELGVSLYA